MLTVSSAERTHLKNEREGSISSFSERAIMKVEKLVKKIQCCLRKASVILLLMYVIVVIRWDKTRLPGIAEFLGFYKRLLKLISMA